MRPATPAEVDRMRTMVEQGMREGAFGLSAGLEYVPGRWSETSELFPLVEAAGRSGGVYVVHERSSGVTPMWYWPSQDEPGPPTMIETIVEDIEIAERTGVTTVATHIKARGADFWGAGSILIDLIERARGRGVPIWADSYPYNTTGSDGSTVLIPGWLFQRAREAGRRAVSPADALERALAHPDDAERVRADIAHEIGRRGGPENLIIMEARDSALVGRSLADLMVERDASATEVAIALQLEGDRSRPGGVALRAFSLAEIDVEAFASRPWVATASDAGVALPGDGPVHARYYGTFPRKIRRYALDGSATSLESAIRSATSLPAQILGLRDRGMVREGFHADLAVLDLDELRDEATFFEPHRYASGVDYVLVGGRFVVDEGEPTYALPGRIITPGTDGKGRRRPTP
jgi:N-acyl-D-amino-acid deacylase